MTSKSTKITPNYGSAYVGTGLLPPGIVQRSGGKEYSTSLLSKEKKPSSSIGKLVRSGQTTTTKRPFTVSQFSPPTLLCDQCGRSTFILTLVKTGKRHFLGMRCTCCGTFGKVACGSWKEILSLSPTHLSVVPDALLAGHKVDHANSRD